MTLLQALICSIAAAPVGLHGKELSIQVTDASGQPLENTVIVLEAAGASSVQVTEAARMTQQNRQFDPHVLVIRTGTGVEFPNLDNTQHHVYSFSPARTFELELYAGQPEAPVVFGTTGVVELGCNIHDQMQAFVVITDSAFQAVSDAGGQARLTIPDDTGFPLQLRVWHPRLEDNRDLQTVTVDSANDGRVAFALSVAAVPEPSGSLDRLQQRFRDL
ncbi:methylamine utilization protein [uncultured Marinobacter sp.]|uniref:methylamine utilization protein n=1 Tax=uncultured Marinobacter sp. TaxID=187379 RepID=UPI0030DD1AB9